MKPAPLTYTPDQKRAITLLEQKLLNRDELLPHFPGKTKQQIAIMA